MPKIIARQTIALPIAALSCATAAGAWIGFTSCGGYTWYSYPGYGALTLAILAALLTSDGFSRRACLATLVFVAFLLGWGAGSAYYVGAGSPGEYLRQFATIFGSGPC